jgi:hypothetical protein
MIAYLAIVATLAALASIGRLILAWLDYQHRWRHLPVEFYGRRKDER